jgi:hypothetical protein
MKTAMKRKIILGLIVATLTYVVLAFIFMWPPVVREWSPANFACVNNLRQIDAAVNEWALENGKHAGDLVTLEQIKPYIKLDSHGEIPRCPAGGKYTVTVVGAPPTCSLGTTNRIRLGLFYWENIGPHHRLP